MKTYLNLLFLTFLSVGLFAQEETPVSKRLNEQFIRFYNTGAADSVYNLFSEDMQQTLPLKRTSEFIRISKLQTGVIKSNTFQRYQDGYAFYQTTFERGVMGLFISTGRNGKIDGLYIKAVPKELERNLTPMILPFRTEWTVTWGGDTPALNYHNESRAQRNAIDFVMNGPDGRTYRTTGRTNEDYYAFGKEIVSSSDGEVLMAVDGVKDNVRGLMNPTFLTGNTVIIKTASNEYIYYCHLKQGSVKVRQGQKVLQGDFLGLCGNSGNSSEPHLHFHIQNVEKMNEATGIKTHFSSLMVNGQLKTDYSPVKNERVQP